MEQTTERTSVFRRLIEIDESDVDVWNHTNNVCYVQWMQDVAVGHSEVCGWDSRRYLDAGAIWVVRRHQIDYRRSTYRGDKLIVQTWIHEMKRASCIRRYRFYKLPNGADVETWRNVCGLSNTLEIEQTTACELVAEAETHWAFLDKNSMRPVRVFPELVAIFQAARKNERD